MSGDDRASVGGYRTQSGEYRTAPGRARTADDGHPNSGGERRTTSGVYRADTGDRRTDRRTDSGAYRAGSGGYRTASGDYRTSGGHRAASGSHRVDQGRQSRRRLPIILAGAAAGIAVCAMFAVGVIALGDGSSGPSARVSAQEAGTQQTGGGDSEVASVPDACSLVTDQQAEKLVPRFDRNQLNSASNTDTHSQCTWTLFSTDSGHQLTVELRVIAAAGGRSASAAAEQTFESERASDDSGKGGLSATQHIISHKALQNVGDGAYIAYSVDDSKAFGNQDFGDAGLNARVGNVLVTVHYGGSDKGGPMKVDKATDGATAIAKDLIRALAKAS